MSQHRRVEAAQAGHRSIFNHFTPSGTAAHRVEDVTSYFRVTSASVGVIDKPSEASLCLGERFHLQSLYVLFVSGWGRKTVLHRQAGDECICLPARIFISLDRTEG